MYYYEETTKRNLNNIHFTLEWHTKWQHKMMLTHGHQSGAALDAAFGTNDKKVIILT